MKRFLLAALLLLSAVTANAQNAWNPRGWQGGGTIAGATKIYATDTEAFLVGKAGDTGDVFKVDTSTTQLSYSNTGLFSDSYVFAGSTVTPQFNLVNDGTMRQAMYSFGTSTQAGFLTFVKANGTQAAPTIVASGDTLGSMLAVGYDGVDYAAAASIAFKVDSTPGSNDMPGRISFLTSSDGFATLTERLKIDSEGSSWFTSKRVNINQTVQVGNVYPALEIDGGIHTQITSGFYDVDWTLNRELNWSVLPTFPNGYVGFRIQGPTITSSASGSILSTMMQIESLGSMKSTSVAEVGSSVGLTIGSYSGDNDVEAESSYAIVFVPQGLPDNSNFTSGIQRSGLHVSTFGNDLNLGNQTATVESVQSLSFTGYGLYASTNPVTVERISQIYIERAPYFSSTGGNTAVMASGKYPYSIFVDAGDVRIDGRWVGNGGNVASANDLTPSVTGNTTFVTGTTQINAIAAGSYQEGSWIVLSFSDNVTVKNNTAGGAGFYPMLLAAGADFSATANDTLMLVYTGSYWQEVSRSVN